MTSTGPNQSIEDPSGHTEWAAGRGLLRLIPWFPIAAERPIFLSGSSSWSGHIPFAFWSIAALRPRVLVELGTMAGDSYLAFCQAIAALSLSTRAHAVDHWKGDEQAGFYGEEVYEGLKRYHDERYGRFSCLHRMDFEEALALFPEGSIDLLHIDGCYRYEAVRRDFLGWLPKLSRRAVVLLHDVTEWRRGFGVWRLWKELKTAYPSFLFPHAHGLGVLRIGPDAPEAFQELVNLSGSGSARVRRWFARLGQRVTADAPEGGSKKERVPPDRGVPQDDTLAEPGFLLEKIGTDPAWRLLEGMQVLSLRSREFLSRARALAQELADEGLPSSSRWQALVALRQAAENLIGSRSFRSFAFLATTSRSFVRGDGEGAGARLRNALRKSFELLLAAAGAEEALPWRDSLSLPLKKGADRQALRECYRKSLEEFLQDGDRLGLPSAAEPEISIVIVLFNQAELTYACLRSLAIHLAPSSEVILVDNASTDRTGELLERVDGVRIFRNPENLHFLRAANQGAAAARGRLLLFLNNDAQILPGTVEAAQEALESDSDVGAVGARIVNLDGRLQEAGSFFRGDGSPQGYGRGDSPLRREYLFRREADYCSGAFLLTRSSLFREMGGFDEVFAPAYFEEADYCLRLWESGKRVLYEPEAVVLHWEFGSSDAEQAIEWMRRHQQVFVERHRPFLEGRGGARLGPFLAPIPPRARVRLLYIDDRVPRPELGSGYPRANAIVRELVRWGAQVTLLPMSGAWEDWEEIYWNVPREVEVLRGMDASVLKSYLEVRVGAFDLVWISRPYNMAYLSAIQGWKKLLPGARLVYDAEALFALRDIQGAELLHGAALPKEEAARRIDREIGWARGADRVVSVSEEEAREFRARGIENVRVIGHAILPAPTAASFEERKDFLLVGGVRDWQSPNGDALLWFAQKVFPRVREGWAKDPPKLVVVGEGTDSPELLGRLGSGVVGIGPAADLTPYYERARVFVAPTRFAAGIPMKAHEAAARGVPMVTSALIARQLGWNGEALLSAPVEDEESFAKACRALYTDPALWERMRAGVLASATRDCDPKRFSEEVHELLDEMAGRKKAD